MTEPLVYIGYKKIIVNGVLTESIALSTDATVFTREYYPIIAETGEGSFANLLFKLKRGIEELKGGKSKDGCK